MPSEIEFSVLSDPGDLLAPLLDQFQAETGVRVRTTLMDWDLAWNQLVRAAIYNNGPDISEIGSTWTRDLIGMNALRLFSAAEVAQMGYARAFVPAAWENAVPAEDGGAWSIPWVAGSRLIFYRPALFEAAGVDPAAAFASPEALDAAVERLHACGASVPWVVSTGGTHATLHNVASWIWAAGGDFVQPDGRSMALTEPAALRGLAAYYRLGRYLSPEISLMSAGAPEDYLGANAGAAMTISGPWLFSHLRDQAGDWAGAISVGSVPGPSFVGGSNLVVWKYSRQAQAAAQLARFLSRADVQARVCPQVGLLPTRVEALEAAPYTGDPYWQLAAQALRGGRTFPSIRLWGVLEDRLAGGLNAVWSELLAHPGADVAETVARLMVPLSSRLNLLLQEK